MEQFGSLSLVIVTSTEVVPGGISCNSKLVAFPKRALFGSISAVLVVRVYSPESPLPVGLRVKSQRSSSISEGEPLSSQGEPPIE